MCREMRGVGKVRGAVAAPLFHEVLNSDWRSVLFNTTCYSRNFLTRSCRSTESLERSRDALEIS